MSQNSQVHEMSLLRLAPYVSGPSRPIRPQNSSPKAAAAAGLTAPMCALVERGALWSGEAKSKYKTRVSSGFERMSCECYQTLLAQEATLI